MGRLRHYVRAARIHWSAGSTFAVILGLTLAWEQGHFAPLWAVSFWVMLICCHAAMQVWDELSDYRCYRAEMYQRGEQEVASSFSSGSGVLTSGDLSYRQLFAFFVALISAFGVVALSAAYAVGPELLLFVVCGLVLAMGYGAPPFRWSYRGLGELALLLLMGPLVTIMVYYATTRIADPAAPFSISAGQWMIAFFPGLMVFAQVFWGQVIDLEEDRAAEKRNLTVRFGTRVALSFQVAAVALCLVIVAALSLDNPWLLPALGVLLYGLKEALWVHRHRDDRDAVAERIVAHPLYRTNGLACTAIVLGSVVHGLDVLGGSLSGAVCLLALTCLSLAVGWRFYVPRGGLESKPSMA